ncbi:hypothetical protein [Tychonema sp. LEGE 06208]|nr:hypothetical protein [Tychonema sp. LEGE 06208]
MIVCRDTALPSPGHGTAVSLQMDFGEITFMFAARDNDLGLLYQ